MSESLKFIFLPWSVVKRRDRQISDLLANLEMQRSKLNKLMDEKTEALTRANIAEGFIKDNLRLTSTMKQLGHKTWDLENAEQLFVSQIGRLSKNREIILGSWQ